MADPYAAAAGFAEAPRARPAVVRPPPSENESFAMAASPGREGDRIPILQREIAAETDPMAKAALQRELARVAPGVAPQSAAATASPAAAPQADPYAAAAGFGPVGAQAAPVPAAPPAATTGNRATDEIAGAGEAAWSLGSGLASSAVGGLAGLAGAVLPGPEGQGAAWSRAVQDAGTYQPRSEAGQRDVAGLAMVNAPFVKAGEWAQEGTEATGAAGAGAMGAIARAGIENLPALAFPGIAGGLRASSGAETAMQAAFRRARGERIEPTFAAKPEVNLAPNPGIDVKFGPAEPGVKTLADATPELRQAVTAKQAAGSPINPTVLERHVAADTLPVPVKLTEGQATMDPALISHEMNGRGKTQPAVSPEFYNAQGKALAANVDAIAAKVAPDIADTGKTTLGQTVVDAYKSKDAPIVADISAKYKALADANGGALPIDGQAFVANTEAALSKALKSGSVPADLKSALEEFKAGRQMTFEDFETLRSDAADAMRSSSDGRARAAAGIIREQLENMPLTAEAAALKPLADAARSAAKARFDALAKDPAYKAAIEDGTAIGEPSPLADRFTDGYVINGRHANVRQMRANLADDPLAHQAIAAAQVEHLRGLAKADPVTGNFSQAGWNKGVQAAGPKLAEILGDEAQTAQALGATAKLAQAQPRGAFVNNSNTATALVAEGAKAAATHGTNMLFGGLPVGSVVRNVGGRVLDSRAAAKATQKATEPGAGLTRLSDVGKK